MRYEAVFFDFDGTLVESAQGKRDAFFRIFPSTQPHFEAIEEVLRMDPDGSRYEVIPRILTALQDRGVELAPGEDVDSLIERYSTCVLEAVNRAPEVAGASETLRVLSAKGITTYLCSNTPQSALEQLVEARGWTKYFSDIAGYPQRKADFVCQRMQESGVQADRVVLVGDGVSDREAAERNHVEFFLRNGRGALIEFRKNLEASADV